MFRKTVSFYECFYSSFRLDIFNLYLNREFPRDSPHRWMPDPEDEGKNYMIFGEYYTCHIKCYVLGVQISTGPRS